MKTLLLITLLFIGGCVSWNIDQKKYGPAGNLVSHTKGSMTQCMVDSTRTKVEAKINDLGKVSIGSSVLDAEELKGILIELMPWIRAALGVMP